MAIIKIRNAAIDLDAAEIPNLDTSKITTGTFAADRIDNTSLSNVTALPFSAGTDWQSTIVTGSTLTAVAGKGYWIDTTSNACTITLPASASVGDFIEFSDYARTWGTNAITINQNSLNFQGYSSPNPFYNTSGQSVSIVYSGATKGWIPTVDDDVTFETPQSYNIEYLVIGGGGSGGSGTNSGDERAGGGGGAGGYRNSYASETSGGGGATETPYSVPTGTVITVTVGSGGTGTTATSQNGNNGNSSSISGSGLTTITSNGGGYGGQNSVDGGSGGSGGGGGCSQASPAGFGGSGTANQGFDGGDGYYPSVGAGGGGGAGAVGQDGAAGNQGGNGGNGLSSLITGSSVTRAGGGGGCGGNLGSGGTGGGGDGASQLSAAVDGTTNTGSGGGGSGDNSYIPYSLSGDGGSGVIILRMLDSNYSGTTTGSPTVTTNVGGSGETVLVFTGSGSYTT